MTLYYNHASLTGDALHYAKVQDIFPGNPFPLPEWEGQMFCQGDFIYVAKGQPLAWHQIKGSAVIDLPPNTITYTMYEEEPIPSEGSGKIHIRPLTGEAWFLTNGEWVQIGGGSGSVVPFSEGVVIGAAPPEGFNAVKILRYLNQYYGFVVKNNPQNFGGDSYQVYPVYPNGSYWGEVIATVSPVDSTYMAFVGVPSNWAGENANHLQISVTIAGVPRKVYFNYDDVGRIFEILGVQP